VRILAIDPGAALGWASDLDGSLRWGEEDISLRRSSTEGLRWLKLTRWLEAQLNGAAPGEILTVYEEQNNFDRHNSSSADVGKTSTAFLLEFCERRGIACEAVGLSKLKSFAIPAPPRAKKGEPKHGPLDRGKAAMIAAALKRLNGEIVSHDMIVKMAPIRADSLRMSEHEADALWLYWWAKKKYA